MDESIEQYIARNSNKPLALVVVACRTNDVALMERALSVASQPDSPSSVQQMLCRGLRRAAARNSVDVLKFVLNRGANVAQLTAHDTLVRDEHNLPTESSQEALEVVLAHGWDINTRGPHGDGYPLLWWVIEHPNLVRWCLDHGAEVHRPLEPPQRTSGRRNLELLA